MGIRSLVIVVVGLTLLSGDEAPRQDDPPVFAPPATQPAEPPPNPFGNSSFRRKDAIPGYVELSTGELAVGRIFTTRDKRLRLYDRKLKRFLPIPLRSLRRIEAHLEWAREEPEWRWREMGNDDKVYSGRSYPVLKVHYTLTLLDGRAFTGDCQTQPLYVADEKGRSRYVLWQRHKGEIGQTLDDLRYIKSVHFGEAAAKRGEALIEKDPSRRARTRDTTPNLDRPPIFIGEEDAMIVHRHTCRIVEKTILPVGFLTLAHALKAGYKPCTECKPTPHKRATTRPARSADPASAPRGGFVGPEKQ